MIITRLISIASHDATTSAASFTWLHLGDCSADPVCFISNMHHKEGMHSANEGRQVHAKKRKGKISEPQQNIPTDVNLRIRAKFIRFGLPSGAHGISDDGSEWCRRLFDSWYREPTERSACF